MKKLKKETADLGFKNKGPFVIPSESNLAKEKSTGTGFCPTTGAISSDKLRAKLGLRFFALTIINHRKFKGALNDKNSNNNPFN